MLFCCGLIKISGARSDDKMKRKFVEVEGTIKVKIKKKFVAFLWGGTLLPAQDVVLIVVVMTLVK